MGLSRGELAEESVIIVQTSGHITGRAAQPLIPLLRLSNRLASFESIVYFITSAILCGLLPCHSSTSVIHAFHYPCR